jgi:hypothetical protein
MGNLKTFLFFSFARSSRFADGLEFGLEEIERLMKEKRQPLLQEIRKKIFNRRG